MVFAAPDVPWKIWGFPSSAWVNLANGDGWVFWAGPKEQYIDARVYALCTLQGEACAWFTGELINDASQSVVLVTLAGEVRDGHKLGLDILVRKPREKRWWERWR
jgi:hypothetical protein